MRRTIQFDTERRLFARQIALLQRALAPVLPSEQQRGITLEYYTKEECKAALRSVSAAIDECEETIVSGARLESMLSELLTAIRFGCGGREI